MATHVIGTGGDFATPQLWEDDIPATLTEQRIGQCKNEEFIATLVVIDFSAHVTTSSFNIILETQSGASFKDNANVRTNALRYNASNGCGFRTTDVYNTCIYFSGAINHLTIRNLQVKAAGNTVNGSCIHYNGFLAGTDHIFKDMICEKTGTLGHAVRIAALLGTSVVKVINMLVIVTGASGGGILSASGANVFTGCTVVRPSNVTAADTGFNRTYDTPKMISCAVFGFTTCAHASYDSNSKNNATDLASGLPGSNNQHSVTYSSSTPFVNGTSASSAHDFRLANDGNALINAGFLDATNAPSDISGTARNDPPEIGMWELVAAAGRTTKNTRSSPLGTEIGMGWRMDL